MRKIGLALDDSFNVKERNGRFLITPTKGKHVWGPEELHLRSLLTDAEGNVLSSGFEKFRNYGEDAADDAAFLKALERKAVSFTEKMDGTLIILDWIDGAPHFRTRGNFDLGDFHDPVMELVKFRYPKLLEWFSTDDFLGTIARRSYSILFEYVAPTNRIVIRYEEPQLVLLGVVNKKTLVPQFDDLTLDSLAYMTGVPKARKHVLPFDMKSLGPVVRGWQDKEGVVAEFVASMDGIVNVPKRLKIKASQYVKLHSLKFKLEGNVGKLLFLLGAQTTANAFNALHEMGVDFEAAEFIRDEVLAYIEKLTLLASDYNAFTTQLNEIHRAVGGIEPREQRKRFVQLVREYIEENHFPQSFFGAAMKLYDDKHDEAWLQVAAAELMGESVQVLKNWHSNPQLALNEMLSVPVIED